MTDRKRRNVLEQAACEARKATFYRAMAAGNGNVKVVAANLGIHRTHVYALMKEYGFVIEKRIVPKEK